MKHQARKHGGDEHEWGIVGLVHDMDYEQFPEEHCQAARRILEAQGWPAAYIRAVESHAWTLFTDVEPKTLLELTLFAIDELTGFVVACALVRPSRSVMDLEVESVRKKWKTRSFAASVNRDIVEKGISKLGTTFDELARDVIFALREQAPAVGL